MNMGSIGITKANHSDVPEIVEIENESFTCPWSAKSFTEAIESEQITVYAAKDADTGAICGFSCIAVVDSEAEILNIAVGKACRERGTGSALMTAMLDRASSSGVTDFYLEVRESNAPARHLYEKFGFVKLGLRKKYYEKPVEDAIVMHLRPEA